MSDWDPDSYLKYERERTQPVRDLAARIEIADPTRIIDLGCGPGNSTAVLRQRWPKAQIVGLDRSPAMLEKARSTHSDIEWVQDDIGADLSRYGSFDLVFANASLPVAAESRRVDAAVDGEREPRRSTGGAASEV